MPVVSRYICVEYRKSIEKLKMTLLTTNIYFDHACNMLIE